MVTQSTASIVKRKIEVTELLRHHSTNSGIFTLHVAEVDNVALKCTSWQQAKSKCASMFVICLLT